MKTLALFILISLYSAEAFSQNRLSNMERMDGYKLLFDGTSLDGWVGNRTDYVVQDGMIVILPGQGGKGNLFTEKEYSNFSFRFEFNLPLVQTTVLDSGHLWRGMLPMQAWKSRFLTIPQTSMPT
jgi:hypothetical protein